MLFKGLVSLIYRAKPPPFRRISIHVLFIKTIKQGLTTVKGIWEQYLSSYSVCWVASGDLITFLCQHSQMYPSAFQHFLYSSLICTLPDLFVFFSVCEATGSCESQFDHLDSWKKHTALNQTHQNHGTCNSTCGDVLKNLRQEWNGGIDEICSGTVL